MLGPVVRTVPEPLALAFSVLNELVRPIVEIVYAGFCSIARTVRTYIASAVTIPTFSFAPSCIARFS